MYRSPWKIRIVVGTSVSAGSTADKSSHVISWFGFNVSIVRASRFARLCPHFNHASLGPTTNTASTDALTPRSRIATIDDNLEPHDRRAGAIPRP